MTSAWQRALDPSSIGEQRFACGQVLPRAAPSTLEEWTALLEAVATDRLRCLPLGAGSSQRWRTPRAFESFDLVLSTARWTGVVAYEPGDGTLTARTGSTMASLADATREGGHRLTPDVARPAEATLGGVLGDGRSGLDRLRFGPVRHNVLGVRALHANATVARSGGNLVKNVTGYDLHRLYTGSRGSLCVLLEASLRLAPEPDVRAAGVRRCAHRDEALEAGRSVLDLALQPDAVVVEGEELTVFLSGRRDVVAWQEELLRRELSLEPVADAARCWIRMRDGADAPALHFGCRPSRLAATLEETTAKLASTGLAFTVQVHPCVATFTLTLEEGLDLIELEDRLRPSGLRIGPQRGPAAPARDALERRLIEALDPTGLFAAGGAERHG